MVFYEGRRPKLRELYNEERTKSQDWVENFVSHQVLYEGRPKLDRGKNSVSHGLE
jgi:hypothetical protein